MMECELCACRLGEGWCAQCAREANAESDLADLTQEQKIACYQMAANSAVEAFVVSRISDAAKSVLLGRVPPKDNAGATAMLEDFGLLEARYPDVRPFIWAFRRTDLGKRVRDRLRDGEE